MTSDQRTRTAQRRGDRVAVLTERMRRGDRAPWACPHPGVSPTGIHHVVDPTHCPECQGTGRAPFRSAVELAAYAGDEAARAVLGEPFFDTFGKIIDHGEFKHPVPPVLADFLAGLARWPGALERFALYACEAWADSLSCAGENPTRCDPEAECQRGRAAIQAARAHLDAPSEETREACGDQRAGNDPARLLCFYLFSQHPQLSVDQVILEAARLAGEATVLAAAKRGLVAWALS